ncbi:pilus assembly protein TadG-related protein [Aestuariivirga sp.]|uniref:pilus assembly protein TadG-related protein n=1 Tax=Aestuariivirga sp. TaxID=2650926 RepID=UPI0039E3708C
MFKTVTSFLRNASGSTSVTLALSVIPLMAAAGGAVDYARWSDARVQVGTALDAAVLTGTQRLAETKGDEAAALKAASNSYAKAIDGKVPLARNTVKFALNKTKTGLSATGDAAVSTSLLRVVGIDEIQVFSSAASETVEADYTAGNPGGDLEISLMLDVTGSMCNDGNGPCTSGTKITALKDAAKKLIDTVVWDDQSKYTSRIAIVPFSTRVRVGPDGGGASAMAAMTGLPATYSGFVNYCVSGSGSGGSEGGGSWTCTKTEVQQVKNLKIMPCVTDRFYNTGWKFDYTDDAPGKGQYLNAHDGSRSPNYVDSSTTKATSGLGATASDPTTTWNYDSNGGCADVANGNRILALSNDKTVLKKKIDGLEAFGSTGGVLGTAFSWYMLSPNWKGVWGSASAPKAYSLLKEKNSTGAAKLRKIAILMTDGVYNTYRGWKDQSASDLSNAAITMCTEMKKKGIEVYTIGFGLDELPAKDKSLASATLKSCGSDVSHFYSSTNAKELMAAFDAIGSQVSASSIRLTR